MFSVLNLSILGSDKRLSLWKVTKRQYLTQSQTLSLTVYKCGCNFWVCEWNPSVWPFKWKLLSSTFMWYCLFFTILANWNSRVFVLRFELHTLGSERVIKFIASWIQTGTNMVWFISNLWSFLPGWTLYRGIHIAVEAWKHSCDQPNGKDDEPVITCSSGTTVHIASGICC